MGKFPNSADCVTGTAPKVVLSKGIAVLSKGAAVLFKGTVALFKGAVLPFKGVAVFCPDKTACSSAATVASAAVFGCLVICANSLVDWGAVMIVGDSLNCSTSLLGSVKGWILEINGFASPTGSAEHVSVMQVIP
jgi:hypothetical protein